MTAFCRLPDDLKPRVVAKEKRNYYSVLRAVSFSKREGPFFRCGKKKDRFFDDDDKEEKGRTIEFVSLCS